MQPAPSRAGKNYRHLHRRARHTSGLPPPCQVEQSAAKEQEAGPSWAPPTQPPQNPRSTGPPRLACLQLRVCFSPVPFKTHMTTPKGHQKCFWKLHEGRAREGPGPKVLTAQASGVRPGGRETGSNMPSLGDCLSFPHLTIYTLSISGLFFSNRLFKPPSYPKNSLPQSQQR